MQTALLPVGSIRYVNSYHTLGQVHCRRQISPNDIQFPDSLDWPQLPCSSKFPRIISPTYSLSCQSLRFPTRGIQYVKLTDYWSPVLIRFSAQIQCLPEVWSPQRTWQEWKRCRDAMLPLAALSSAGCVLDEEACDCEHLRGRDLTISLVVRGTCLIWHTLGTSKYHQQQHRGSAALHLRTKSLWAPNFLTHITFSALVSARLSLVAFNL